MRTGKIEWATESLMLPGQRECGDRYVVREVPGGVLIAVMDGIGHGHEAAEAAGNAVAVIESSHDRSLIKLMQNCHKSLQHGRGVVMSLATLDGDNTMTWLGVGNVDGNLVRWNSPDGRIVNMLVRQGIVGKQLPGLITSNLAVSRNDLLIFTTDGILRNYADKIDHLRDPQEIAEDIITNHSKKTDDALVLVGRYVG